MGVRLVNTVPGDVTDPIKPGAPFQFGLRSEDSLVELGSLRLTGGFSSVQLGVSVPESDQHLLKVGASVSLQTTEHRFPITDTIGTSIVSSQLHLSKATNSDNTKSVYEIKMPIDGQASVMAYARFRTATWTLFNPDWVNLSSMTGIYLGLEHGVFNTAIYGFLRNASLSDGSLVVGGVLPNYGSARPSQQEIAGFDWASLAADTAIEVFFFFNIYGYPPPFSPAFVPVVEVWTRIVGVDGAPIVQAIIPVGALGQFQTGGFDNIRKAPTDFATFYMGLAGRSGDLLKIDDFVLFPDYRVMINEGAPTPGSTFTSIPDSPVVYRPSDGARPAEMFPGRWLQTRGGTQYGPVDTLKYRSGQNKTPTQLNITKSRPGRSAFFKKETRLEVTSPVSSTDGIMVEAFMAGDATLLDGETVGAGFAVDDGSKLYEVLMLDSDSQKTYGLVKNTAALTSLANGYYTPTVPQDYRSPKLVRLVVDRHRNLICLDVDEQRVLEQAIGSTFPSTEGDGGKVMFGHLYTGNTKARQDVNFLNYMPRYLAYETSDNLLPTASPVTFTSDISGSGSQAVSVADGLQILKTSFSDPGSQRIFEMEQDFQSVGGILIDVKMRINAFTDAKGTPFASLTATGVSVDAFLGDKLCRLSFFDAGLSGKMIGIVPGSGSIDDLINQTSLGKKFSAPADWTKETVYRIIYRAFSKIEIWAGSNITAPVITIPWRNDTDGFDLPADVSTPKIAFGHYDENTSSTSFWRYLRWGSSNGYDVAIQRDVDETLAYLFGGKVQVSTTFGF